MVRCDEGDFTRGYRQLRVSTMLAHDKASIKQGMDRNGTAIGIGTAGLDVLMYSPK
jgi:hypothetical protein